MVHFNLVDEPWIPCVMLADNTRQDLSLRDVFARSREIREIFDPSPLVTVSLHRLLLAILHRNFGPSNMNAWRELWERGHWDVERLNTYFDQWRHRFNLFDDQRPFYQVPYMDDAKIQPIALLSMELASGNNVTLFDHNFDAFWQAMMPAQAARRLLARQGFSIGFGKSSPFYLLDAPLTRGFTILVRGDNLFETLALNLTAYNEERPFAHTGEDLPQWEQSPPALPDKGGTPPLGYLDYLTWQSRRIHLLPEDGSRRVCGCQIQQNLKLAEGFLDPFKCYRRDEKKGYLPRGLGPERSLWRDSHTLFQNVDPSSARPEVFNWVARIDGLRHQNKIQAHSMYSFSVLGFATDEGKAGSVILWRHEHLPLPLRYLQDINLLDKLKYALDITERVGQALVGSARTLAAVLLKPDVEKKDELAKAKKDEATPIQELVDSWVPQRRYWSQLETLAARFLVDLAADRFEDEEGEWEYGTAAMPGWTRNVEHAAWSAFVEMTSGLGTSGRILKAVVWAERELKSGFYGILKGYRNENERNN